MSLLCSNFKRGVLNLSLKKLSSKNSLVFLNLNLGGVNGFKLNLYSLFFSKTLEKKYNLMYVIKSFFLYNFCSLLAIPFLSTKFFNRYKFSLFFSNYQKKFNVLSVLNFIYMYYLQLNNIKSLNFFIKVFFIGVGFKIFKYRSSLYLRLGFSKVVKLKIPPEVFILIRKRSLIKLISMNLNVLNNFIQLLKQLRSFDKYKGKGIYFLDNFSDIKLKVGKKQQFF